MDKHSTRKKLAFAAADVYGGGSFNIVNFLYPGFLALTVGISPYWIGFVMLFARIWDAITDPLMGFISDRTKSRFGKRRVYLIFVSPLVLVSMFLLFFPFAFDDVALRIIAVLLSYIVFATVQTMVMIPYYSLSSEITSDYQERASYNSYRLGFSIFASILCVAVPGIVVNSFADAAVGYQVMSLSFGLLFALAVLTTGLFAREEIQTPVLSSKIGLRAMAKPLGLKPFRQYLGMFLVLQFSMAVMSGLFFFYVDFYATASVTANGDSSMVGLIAAALMFAMQIVALPIYLKLIAKYGKTFAYRLGAMIWIVMAIVLLVLPKDANPLYIYLLGAIMGLGISGPGLVPHTMYGDVVDAGQLKFRERLDGQMSGFTNFINKIAQAVGLAFVMFLLGLAGFQERAPGAAPILSQPDSATTMIRVIMAFTPLIFMGIGMLISLKYKLDKKAQAAIQVSIHNDYAGAEDLLGSL
ncbi:MAG: MFS transporter [Bacillus subtilis]|nr:MFS transporter [Bacillus subtilis]